MDHIKNDVLVLTLFRRTASRTPASRDKNLLSFDLMSLDDDFSASTASQRIREDADRPPSFLSRTDEKPLPLTRLAVMAAVAAGMTLRPKMEDAMVE